MNPRESQLIHHHPDAAVGKITFLLIPVNPELGNKSNGRENKKDKWVMYTFTPNKQTTIIRFESLNPHKIERKNINKEERKKKERKDTCQIYIA